MAGATSFPLPFKLLLTCLLTIFSLAAHTADNRNTVTKEFLEADSFLTRLPRGLQHQQAEAIRAATKGDYAALEGVRNARNKAAELPAGVRRSVISPRLTMFRSERYANDTIPLLVYFHGGGWVIGSVNSCSAFCGAMADKGIAVLAVDYRLAPEHPFPAGLNDCIEAIHTAADSLGDWRCSSISAGGDSSGGNLAIAAAMRLPEGTLSRLITFYPVTRAYANSSESWYLYGDGYGLDSDLMDAFNYAYTSDPHNPSVSPAEASDDDISKLPPTLIIGAERDILRSQGAQFAARLENLGNDVSYLLIPGSVHLFITVPGQPAAFGRAVKESSEFILDTRSRK